MWPGKSDKRTLAFQGGREDFAEERAQEIAMLTAFST